MVGQQEQQQVSGDVFTTEEAAVFLKLPNARAFRRRCREYGVSGVRSGNNWIFAREQLELLRRKMFALDPRPMTRPAKAG